MKRHLSGNSNQEEGAKKYNEGSLNTSRSSDIPDEVFTKSLKSPDCVNNLFSCIKNVEKQITQIFKNTKEMAEVQIRSKKQLVKLTAVIGLFQIRLMNARKIDKKMKNKLRHWKNA